MGAGTTLPFALTSHRELVSAMDQNRRVGKEFWAHNLLVNQIIATEAFEILLDYCSAAYLLQWTVDQTCPMLIMELINLIEVAFFTS